MSDPTYRSFEIAFRPDSRTLRFVWRRFYVPGLTDDACHVLAIEAVRSEYPAASLIAIVH